ncbi:hypothetical protein AVEN_245410-1 [Araneus ventricosus]|uniref:Uncharacterized protein n=1 Tax=Araneus ventricosus TaxID=182803 RepID=A0A4Y2LCV1_ARAVE|nr:hypothetical protein AVEN_245410-1 [Araneus ventricosus]
MRSPSRFIIGKSHNVKSSFVGQPVRSPNGQSARSLQTPPDYVIQGRFTTSRLPFSSRFRRVRWRSGLVGTVGSGDPTRPWMSIIAPFGLLYFLMRPYQLFAICTEIHNSL